MNICLLPQTPVLRRPKKANNYLVQRVMEPIPSSGRGYGPHQTPALQDRMLSCLEFEIEVITNYVWSWAQGGVEGIWYLLRIMYQTRKCSRPGGSMMGHDAVHSEPPGWELSTADDRNRYFVDVYQLVLFQRQRKKKIHINMTVTGNCIYRKSCQFHVSSKLLIVFNL